MHEGRDVAGFGAHRLQNATYIRSVTGRKTLASKAVEQRGPGDRTEAEVDRTVEETLLASDPPATGGATRIAKPAESDASCAGKGEDGPDEDRCAERAPDGAPSDKLAPRENV